MSKSKKIVSKIRGTILAFLIALSTLAGNINPVEAATYQPISLGDIAGTGAEVKLGYNTAWWRNGIGKIQ